MIMKKLLSLYLIILSICAIGQPIELVEFPTENAHWRVLTAQVVNTDTILRLHYYVFKSDTLVGGVGYRQLVRSSDPEDLSTSVPYALLRTTDSAQKVYIRYQFPNPLGDDEILLYDYSLQRGDTFMRRVSWNGKDTTLLTKAKAVRTFTAEFNYSKSLEAKTKMITLNTPGMAPFGLIPKEVNFAYWGSTLDDPFSVFYYDSMQYESGGLECFVLEEVGNNSELAGLCDLSWADSLVGNVPDTSTVGWSDLNGSSNIIWKHSNSEMSLLIEPAIDGDLSLFDISGRLISQNPIRAGRVSFSTEILNAGIHLARIHQGNSTIKIEKLCIPSN